MGLHEPDAEALRAAATALGNQAREYRRMCQHTTRGELDALYERRALQCEQVADWLDQRAERMDV